MDKIPYLMLHTEKGSRYLSLVGSNYWTIGRSKDNDFVISDQWISRNHAMLQSTATKEFYLIDLGSRNGTFVNGRRVSIPVILRDSDRIIFGKTELDFHCPKNSKITNSPHSNNKIEYDAPTSTLHVRRLMSVMVIDIRNFTLLARQLDENILSLLIGSWFRQAGNIIRNSGSWVDKYIGDAVMAIWFHGQKQVTNQELARIFGAVIALKEMTAALNLREEYSLAFELRIGAGLNTGYAMVGNTGSGDHPDYTAIGDTVNLAFRLESATKQTDSDIVLGETTYEYLSQIDGLQDCFKKHNAKLKGYEGTKVIYAGNFESLDDFFLDDFSKDRLSV